MKETILDTIRNLSRDMREVAELRSEQQDIDAETFRMTAVRLDALFEIADSWFHETEERAKCAARWKFLFNNPDVSFQVREPEVLIFQNIIRDGEVVGQRLISRGVSFTESVDAALKFPL